jgi:hypothetical protein
MDWIKALVWVLHGRGWMTFALAMFVVAVYAHVPLQTLDSSALAVATSVSAGAR